MNSCMDGTVVECLDGGIANGWVDGWTDGLR